jgi:Carbohydrate binding module (family 35)
LGFGYVSAFTKDKQGFAVEVDAAKAGKYSLAWRYTAGEGACVRTLLVNGQSLAQAQQFPATPSWTAWTNSVTTTDLLGGKNTIELRFDSAKGSKTSLDIDQLILAPM